MDDFLKSKAVFQEPRILEKPACLSSANSGHMRNGPVVEVKKILTLDYAVLRVVRGIGIRDRNLLSAAAGGEG